MEKVKIIKIAILGAESTGKSTLAINLATHFNSVYVSEYAREYFNNADINNYSPDVFETIYRKQIENENLLINKANNFLFCDTSLITGKIWSEEVFGEVTPFIKENISKIEYDLYLVTNNEVPWVEDKQRKNPNNREELFEKNLSELKALGANFKIITGLNQDRLNNAIKIIEELFKEE